MTDKVLKITSLKDDSSETMFWLSKSIEERLATIEFLRQQYIKSLPVTEQRLQRVCKIIDKNIK